MEAKLTELARRDKEKIPDEKWKVIKARIKSVDTVSNHPDTKLIPNPILDHPIWQLNVEERDVNYRVYIDIEGSTLVVLAIWSFDFTHSGDRHWQRLDERM